MSQSDIRPFRTHPADVRPAVARPADFESRMRFGLSEVLTEHPELREVLPLAAMMDDAVRWCA